MSVLKNTSASLLPRAVLRTVGGCGCSGPWPARGSGKAAPGAGVGAEIPGLSTSQPGQVWGVEKSGSQLAEEAVRSVNPSCEKVDSKGQERKRLRAGK